MIKKLLIIAITMFLSLNLVAMNEIDIEKRRNSSVNNYVLKENKILNLLEKYILESGKYNIVKSEIISYYNLESNIFENLTKDNEITINLNNDYILTTNNVNINSLNDLSLRTYKDNINREENNVINENYELIRYLTREVKNFIKDIKEIETNSNIIISTTQPLNNTKLWYKPNGVGGFKIYDNTNSWSEIGEYNTLLNNKNCYYYYNDVSELNRLTNVTDKYCAKVKVENNFFSYFYDKQSDTWLLEGFFSNLSKSDLFKGTSSILYLRTDLITKSGLSEAEATRYNGEYRGYKKFIKYDKKDTNGFWIRQDGGNKLFVSDNLEGMKLYNTFFLNDKGWYSNIRKDKLFYLNYIFLDGSNRWVYQFGDYKELSEIEEPLNNSYRCSSIKSKCFKFNNNVWTSLTNDIQVRNMDFGREGFTNHLNNVFYLVYNNDCNSSNCNGSPINSFYLGNKLDDIYKFYYSTVGKRKNDLTDRIPRRNLYECYDNNDSRCLVTGNIYIQETDINGNIVFKRISNNQFYMGNGIQLPSSYITSGKRNIPTTKRMRDITLTSGIINLNNRTERRNWLLRTNSMRSYILGNSYTFATNGNGRSNYYYWEKSNERFTRGSRTNFQNRLSSSMDYLTLQQGSENKFKSTVEKSGLDSNFYNWIYSSYGLSKNTNRLIDKPCSLINSNFDIGEVSGSQRRCEDNITSRKYCDSGYNYNSSTNRCEKIEIVNKIASGNVIETRRINYSCSGRRPWRRSGGISSTYSVSSGESVRRYRFYVSGGIQYYHLTGHYGDGGSYNERRRVSSSGILYNSTAGNGDCDYDGYFVRNITLMGCPSGYSDYTSSQCRRVLTSSVKCSRNANGSLFQNNGTNDYCYQNINNL